MRDQKRFRTIRWAIASVAFVIVLVCGGLVFNPIGRWRLASQENLLRTELAKLPPKSTEQDVRAFCVKFGLEARNLYEGQSYSSTRPEGSKFVLQASGDFHAQDAVNATKLMIDFWFDADKRLTSAKLFRRNNSPFS